jgi:hypothetical protein
LVFLPVSAVYLDIGKFGGHHPALARLRWAGAAGFVGSAEFARSRDVYARSLSPMASQMYHRMDDQAFMQVATAAVLDERAKRRQHQ